MQLKNKVFITFDIDWAPDYMVNHVIDLCLQYGISATFFVTHQSATLARLKAFPDFFEIGLHPNFLPGSTQGETLEDVFKYCKELVPDALSIRTHCVYQHGRLYELFNRHFGDKIVDSSICMPGCNNIQQFNLYTPSGLLIRAPFFWADDYYLLGKHVLDPIKLLQAEGCKIYMFHPVHLYQNTQNLEEYEKRKTNNQIQNVTEGKGIATLFEVFLESVKRYFRTGLMREFLEFKQDSENASNEIHFSSMV